MSFYEQARGTAPFSQEGVQRVSSSRNCSRNEAESVNFSELPLETFANQGAFTWAWQAALAMSWGIVLHQKSTGQGSMPVFPSRGEILHLFAPKLPHHLYNRITSSFIKYFAMTSLR